MRGTFFLFFAIFCTIFAADGLIIDVKPGDDIHKVFVASKSANITDYLLRLSPGLYSNQSAMFITDYRVNLTICSLPSNSSSNGSNSSYELPVRFTNVKFYFFNFESVRIDGINFTNYVHQVESKESVLEFGRVNWVEIWNSQFVGNRLKSGILRFAGSRCHLGVYNCKFLSNSIDTTQGVALSFGPQEDNNRLEFLNSTLENNVMTGITPSTAFVSVDASLTSLRFQGNVLTTNNFSSFFSTSYTIDNAILEGNTFVSNTASFFVSRTPVGKSNFYFAQSSFQKNKPSNGNRVLDLVGESYTFNGNHLNFSLNDNAFRFDSSKDGLFNLSRSHFNNNTAIDGAGIFLQNRNQKNSTLFRVTFHSNVAQGHGGGLWVYQSVFLKNCSFADNTAGYGAAIASNNSFDLVANDCKFGTQTIWLTAGTTVYAPGFTNKYIKCETGRVQYAQRDDSFFCPDKNNDQMVGFFLMGGIGVLFILTLAFLGYRIVVSRKKARESYGVL